MVTLVKVYHLVLSTFKIPELNLYQNWAIRKTDVDNKDLFVNLPMTSKFIKPFHLQINNTSLYTAFPGLTTFFFSRRITDNVLQLMEESLDSNLSGNCLEIRFADGILLPAVYMFETHTHLSVLAATTNSVHRIVFPHPDRLCRHVSLDLHIFHFIQYTVAI